MLLTNKYVGSIIAHKNDPGPGPEQESAGVTLMKKFFSIAWFWWFSFTDFSGKVNLRCVKA